MIGCLFGAFPCVGLKKSSIGVFPMFRLAGNRIVVLVLCIIAGLVVARTLWADSSRVTMGLVCVATGDRFRFDHDEVGMIPAKNPKSGLRTLVPFACDEGSVCTIVPCCRSLLNTRLKDCNVVVDLETFEFDSRD